MNRVYRREPALHEVDFDPAGFEWIDCHNWELSTLSFIRRAKDPSDYVIACCNFTPVPRVAYSLGVPEACWYEEICNSDSSYYAGSNVGNGPGVMASPEPHHGRPCSIKVTLPPLGMAMFKPRR